jgi:hypothetical protein
VGAGTPVRLPPRASALTRIATLGIGGLYIWGRPEAHFLLLIRYFFADYIRHPPAAAEGLYGATTTRAANRPARPAFG